ncbi:MAG: helix-turn-helix domain containing protein [Deltaproteobacteria bacterium]|nr:helix-turn-helix domain containing protein [Deltaproteobacteria bacterium]
MKIAALLLVLEGQRPGWITQVLGLTRMSLSRWVHGVNQEGIEFLRPNPRSGRPGQLTEKLAHELEDHLERSPREFGWSRVGWDGPTLVVHLKKYFGINLKVRQAQNWMYRLGYRMNRASHVYLQARSEDAKTGARSDCRRGPSELP